MTTTSLALRRDYLVPQRRAIIARSVVGSLASALPVPFLDDWAVGAVIGGGYRAIARSHHVDVAPDAVDKLVHGTTPPPSIVDIASSGIALRIAGRAARRMILTLATINRARSAARTFVAMTLFDHYCAKLHTGGMLDGDTALALRGEIGRAIDNTPGALVIHPFRRGALSAARATLRAPLELADLASGGALRKLLAKRAGPITDAEQVDEVEHAIARAIEDRDSFIGRTVAAVETQLSAEGNPFLDATIESLDRRWRAWMAVR